MADPEHTFAQARARLEDIVGQVRKKDVSLEHSLDLLEEGVRLANACTEQIDQSEWRAIAEELQDEHGAETGPESLRSDATSAAESAWSGESKDAGESVNVGDVAGESAADAESREAAGQ